MRKREFQPEFLQELDAILRSESMRMEFDSAGEPAGSAGQGLAVDDLQACSRAPRERMVSGVSESREQRPGLLLDLADLLLAQRRPPSSD